MNNLKKLIYKKSITNELLNIKKDLIKACLKQRIKLNPKLAYNFEVESKHKNYLYNIFYHTSKSYLNNFTLHDVNFKLWCYLSDKNFHKGRWHNHLKTSTINCVIYLKTQNKGINFKHNHREINIIPKENDLLIFPNFLDHYPEPSKKEPRITLNLEFRCKEDAKDIFYRR